MLLCGWCVSAPVGLPVYIEFLMLAKSSILVQLDFFPHVQDLAEGPFLGTIKKTQLKLKLCLNFFWMELPGVLQLPWWKKRGERLWSTKRNLSLSFKGCWIFTSADFWPSPSTLGASQVVPEMFWIAAIPPESLWMLLWLIIINYLLFEQFSVKYSNLVKLFLNQTVP